MIAFNRAQRPKRSNGGEDRPNYEMKTTSLVSPVVPAQTVVNMTYDPGPACDEHERDAQD